MKKNIKHLALLLFFAMSILPCSAEIETEDEKPEFYKPIVVRKIPKNFHRSLDAPIYAYYMDGAITFEFPESLGTSTVVVQNLTTGGQVVEIIDTSMGDVTVYIDSILTAGDFSLSLTTFTGDFYSAEFTLE